jgi:hypothetical protein
LVGNDYLQSLLILPTQRLARYPLLLGEVLKCSIESHPDYEELKEALRVFSEMAHRVNDAKKSNDQMFRKITLQHEGLEKTFSCRFVCYR